MTTATCGYHLDRMILSAARHDAEVGCCGPCMDVRGIVGASLIGATVVTYLCTMSVLIWDQVSGFADR